MQTAEAKDKAMWEAFKASNLLVPIKQTIEEVDGKKVRAVPTVRFHSLTLTTVR